MGQNQTVGAIYNVETDVADWPKGLPAAEREILIALVRDAIRGWQDIGRNPGTYDLYQQVKHAAERRNDVPTFSKAALLDWLFACVVRAARAADAEQVWSLPRPMGERWVTFKLDLPKDLDVITVVRAIEQARDKHRAARMIAAFDAIATAIRRALT